ncbi:MAG: hypothetical protein IT210_13110 [Armatimonadetes bacterium]|nr:hypothetical protein [Armatimonadota bacterium]
MGHERDNWKLDEEGKEKNMIAQNEGWLEETTICIEASQEEQRMSYDSTGEER